MTALMSVILTTRRRRFEQLQERIRSLQEAGKLPTRVTPEQAADWAAGQAELGEIEETR
jgi:hypothetical protein